MRPKAAARPAATTPDPYSAIMVAAAPLEVLVEAEVAADAPLPLEVGVAVALEELLEATATNVFGSRCPQFCFSSELHLS